MANALFFYQTQRDGPDVTANTMNRQPSHLKDQQASIYSTPTYKDGVLQGSLDKVGGPIDVSGGSLDGTNPLLLGAIVNGPNASASFSDLSTPDNARACPASLNDPFNVFSGKEVRYLDNVSARPSVEPADDYTALTLLVFAQQIQR